MGDVGTVAAIATGVPPHAPRAPFVVTRLLDALPVAGRDLHARPGGVGRERGVVTGVGRQPGDDVGRDAPRRDVAEARDLGAERHREEHRDAPDGRADEGRAGGAPDHGDRVGGGAHIGALEHMEEARLGRAARRLDPQPEAHRLLVGRLVVERFGRLGGDGGVGRQQRRHHQLLPAGGRHDGAVAGHGRERRGLKPEALEPARGARGDAIVDDDVVGR